jgi:hypothetical protein
MANGRGISHKLIKAHQTRLANSLGKQVKAAMNALLGSIPSPIAGKSDYSPPEIHYPLLVIPTGAPEDRGGGICSGPHRTAFALYPRTDRRVPHISLVFREMWDTTGLPLKPVAGPTDP